jgi:outer membrane protein
VTNRSFKVRRSAIVLAAGMLLASSALLDAQGASAPAAPQGAGSPAAPAASQGPATSSGALPVVTLDEVIAAARAAANGMKLARITADTARAQLTQTQASNGLALGAKAGYVHEGTLLGSQPASTGSAAASQGAGGQALYGDTVQGGLTLSGPSTSVGLTAQHSVDQAQTTSGDQVSGLSLSASQTVFDGYPGGRAAAAVSQADYTYRAARVTYDASVKSVITQVTQAYYTLLGDQATVLIRQASVAQAQQNLAYYQGLLGVGRATQLDVLQNQVALTQAQLDLRSAGNAVDTDRKTLSAAVGWPLDRAYAVADAPVPDLPSLTQDDALKTALQNRSELQTLALNLAAANVALRLQQSLAYPVVSLNGSMGVGQDWTANVNTGSFTVGASISLPVLDGGLRGAQVQQAQSQVDSIRTQQDQQTQSISIAVQNALFSVRDTRDRLDLAVQSVKAAQGQYDLQKARYGVGLVTTLDVLSASSALTSAQVGLQQARSAYVLAILNLNNVMGL